MALAIAVSMVAICVIALVLAVLVLARYRRDRRRWHLYWGIGIFLVFVAQAQEAAFYLGLWSQLLIRSYLVVVAVLVGVLSLGSAELSLRGRARSLWYGYVGASCAACAAVCAVTPVSSTILYEGVVWGMPPINVVIVSSLATIPTALLLIVASLLGAVRERRLRLLYITAGMTVFTVSGSLYIVSFPAAMFYAEFLGVVLLFLGFVNVLDRPVRSPRPIPA